MNHAKTVAGAAPAPESFVGLSFRQATAAAADRGALRKVITFVIDRHTTLAVNLASQGVLVGLSLLIIMLPFGTIANLLLAVVITVALAAAASSWREQGVHGAQHPPSTAPWPKGNPEATT